MSQAAANAARSGRRDEEEGFPERTEVVSGKFANFRALFHLNSAKLIMYSSLNFMPFR